MQNYLGLGTVATAIGLILTVWAWKLNAAGANWMLVLAWLLFIVTVYSSVPSISTQPIVPRVLWTMLGSALIGLVLYGGLWSATESRLPDTWSPPIKSTLVSERSVTSEVDGRSLMGFSDRYDVAIVLGVPDPTVDRFRDERIAISDPFTIHSGNITIEVPYTPAMLEAMGSLRADAQRRRANGDPVWLPLQSIWFHGVLLPKGFDVSRIRTLSDVTTRGGRILSQEQQTEYPIRK